MITAEIVADSINPCGNRITTFKIEFWRAVLAEFNTHRAFSRNSASSRAIPIEKQLKRVMEDPALPIYWGRNQSGMQATEEMSPAEIEDCKEIILDMRDYCVSGVKKLQQIGMHKQTANRYLEPWMWHTVLCTATEWENFFSLRAECMAQPDIQVAAYKMLDLYNANTPKQLQVGEWHLPYADRYVDNLTLEQMKKISTARAARVSYQNFEGDIDHDKDYQLHDGLLKNGHMSPFEHAAEAMDKPKPSGNFVGWLQYRKTLPNENRQDPRVIRYAA